MPARRGVLLSACRLLLLVRGGTSQSSPARFAQFICPHARATLSAQAPLLACAGGPGAAALPFKAAFTPHAPPLDASPHVFGFVCGVHFSGTSILHYALGLNPEVSIMRVAPKRMDEGQAFQDVMPTGAAGRAGVSHAALLTQRAPLQRKRLGRSTSSWCAPFAPSCHEAGTDTSPRVLYSQLGADASHAREVGRYFALNEVRCAYWHARRHT